MAAARARARVGPVQPATFRRLSRHVTPTRRLPERPRPSTDCTPLSLPLPLRAGPAHRAGDRKRPASRDQTKCFVAPEPSLGRGVAVTRRTAAPTQMSRSVEGLAVEMALPGVARSVLAGHPDREVEGHGGVEAKHHQAAVLAVWNNA